MKIPTKGTSPYLTIEDVPAPIIATMDRVTFEKSLRNPYVLHFTDDQLPSLPLNVTNRRTIVTAFGDDDQQWYGHRIEVYVDHEVRNSRGEVTGGIRLRIPATGPTGPAVRAGQLPVPPSAPPAAATGPRAVNGAGARAGAVPAAKAAATGNGTAALKPVPGPKMLTTLPPKPQRTLAERHTQVLAGFDAARTEDYLQKMANWARQFPFLDWQTAEQSDRYHAAIERLALGIRPAAPPRSATGA